MSFDWSTFTLEIINFLVLVWLLKHFLYRPVLSMIERRQQAVQKTLQEAQDARDEAGKLQADYQSRNAQWQTELEQRRRALDSELEAERQHRLKALDAEIIGERKRQETLQQHEQALHEKSLQARAAGQSAQFAALLLQRLATPELDRRMLDVTLEDLSALPPERIDALRTAVAKANEILVCSRLGLGTEDRTRLERALVGFASTLPTVRYTQDPDLIAGLRISIGAWELDASLAGELRLFAESGSHA
jgi:F-type H+-transporting ATPase subunit b